VSPVPGPSDALLGSIFGVGSSLRQNLRLSFISADQAWPSRGNRFGDIPYLSQNVTPQAAGLLVRDEEVTGPSSVLSPLP
jgi:hypothetical protein